MQLMGGIDTEGKFLFNGNDVTKVSAERNIPWFINSLSIIQILQFMKYSLLRLQKMKKVSLIKKYRNSRFIKINTDVESKAQ